MEQTAAAEGTIQPGDVIEVIKPTDNLRVGTVAIVESVVRADDPDNDDGEEYLIVNGPTTMGAGPSTSCVKRLKTRAEYEAARPTWSQALDEVMSALIQVEDADEAQVYTHSKSEEPGGPAGSARLALVYTRRDGHQVEVEISAKIRVSDLDEFVL